MIINGLITVTASGPVNVLTGLNGTQMLLSGPVPRTMASRVQVQMVTGGSGRGYVMNGIYGVQSDGVSPRIPSSSAATDVSAELAPATSTAPGGTESDTYYWSSGEGGIDISILWLDGSHVGDQIRFTYDLLR